MMQGVLPNKGLVDEKVGKDPSVTPAYNNIPDTVRITSNLKIPSKPFAECDLVSLGISGGLEPC